MFIFPPAFSILDKACLEAKWAAISIFFLISPVPRIFNLRKDSIEKGVRIGRPFPPFYDWCRISTGTSQEVDIFIESMLEVYS